MRRASLVLLAAITLAGGGLRAAQAVDPPPGLNADERAYVRAAVRLVDERRYVQTHYPPGTPGLFAVAYVLGGRDGLELPAGYWAQALVGTALILATYALAALMAGPWAGLAAAAVVAFHRPFIFRTEKLLSEPLAALLLTAGLAAMAWALREERPAMRRLALAGALLGALAVTRANLALVPVVLAGVLLVACGPRAAAALLVPALVVIAPWSAYASRWEGRFVPLATGSGTSLFVGTYLPGGGSTYGAKLALADEVRRRHPRLLRVPAPRLPGPLVFETVAARHPGLHPDAAWPARLAATSRAPCGTSRPRSRGCCCRSRSSCGGATRRARGGPIRRQRSRFTACCSSSACCCSAPARCSRRGRC